MPRDLEHGYEEEWPLGPPSPQALRNLAEEFRQIQRTRNPKIDIDSTQMPTPCGTVGCIAGHYLVYKRPERTEDTFQWYDGMELFVRALGFENAYAFGKWNETPEGESAWQINFHALYNEPEHWGSVSYPGFLPFYCKEAWALDGKVPSILTADHIATCLDKMATRRYEQAFHSFSVEATA